MSEAIIALPQVLQSPETYRNQTLSVRGFLYKTADDRWILSTEPGLKSCCVGSIGRAGQEIEVFGQIAIAPQSTAVVVTGRMEHTASHLQLHEASLIQSAESSICLLCLLTPMLLLGVIGGLFVANRKR